MFTCLKRKTELFCSLPNKSNKCAFLLLFSLWLCKVRKPTNRRQAKSYPFGAFKIKIVKRENQK
ncbi:hypothetical protein T4B_1154 [Trichinella pseudospiralis]|uniref:Uncharacterized protein n=1 Tax=Trichinella pseudospiralis TaxID=6337 RepID=A0A0V1IKE7_TRIPS|nr:hypothetical protein T4B_1154 [Trichinella pseudospiralis]